MNKPCTTCEKQNTKYTFFQKGSFGCDIETANSCEKYKKYRAKLESRRQYEKGDIIKSIAEFDEYSKSNSFVFWRNKVKHVSVLISLQYRVLIDLIFQGYVCKAIKKENTNENS